MKWTKHYPNSNEIYELEGLPDNFLARLCYLYIHKYFVLEIHWWLPNNMKCSNDIYLKDCDYGIDRDKLLEIANSKLNEFLEGSANLFNNIKEILKNC